MISKILSDLKKNQKLACSLASASVLGAALSILCFLVGAGPQEYYLNFTVLVTFTLIGWMLGILASPYNPGEKKDFTRFGKLISAFISGFVLAKADKAIGQLFSPESLGNTLVIFRLLLAAAGFSVSLIITFVCRRYAKRSLLPSKLAINFLTQS